MKLAVLCVLGLVAVTACRGEFCDEGPPGKYCLEDLSGFHDCKKDEKTGKMVDTIHPCWKSTRCQCFFGPPCPSSEHEPCSAYRTPPLMPNKCSTVGEMHTTVCNKTTCQKGVRHERAYQDEADKTKQKFRLDRQVTDYGLTDIWLQRAGAQKFDQYTIRWDKQTCDRTTWPFITNIDIDSRSSYIGKEKVGTKVVEKWLWKEGGHNINETRLTQTWYLWKNTESSDQHYEPVKLVHFERSFIYKYNFTAIETFSFSSKVDESKFELPEFCPKPSVDIMD